MRNKMNSTLQSPEFKKLLERYEKMIAGGDSIYIEIEDTILLAEYYAAQGNFQRTDKVIAYGLSLHPDDTDLLSFQGHNLIISGRLDEAEALLSSFTDASGYEFMLLKAEILLAKGEKEKGIQLFDTLYKREPSLPIVLDIAQACLEAKIKEQGFLWIERAYQMAPEKIEVLEMMASYHFSYGNFLKAIELYNQLLDRDPYAIDYWHSLTRCYITTQNPEKAMEAIEFAMAIDQSNLHTWELKGCVYFMLDCPEEALECLKYIEDKAENKNYIRTLMLTHFFSNQDFPEVIEYSSKILEAHRDLSNKEIAELYHKRATAYLAMENIEECRKDIEAGLFHDNQNDDLYLIKGDVMLLKEKDEEAAKAFADALLFTAYEEEVLDYIAVSYLKHKKPKEALYYLETREKKYPTLVIYNYYFMAFCYYKLQQEDKMFTYLVRGAYYDEEETLRSNQKMLGKEENEEFFSLAEKVSKQVHDNRIDVIPYLPDYDPFEGADDFEEEEDE